MIHMPRRSVTRFFIPLIDVLLLLFSIFLLMPAFGSEETGDADKKTKMSAEDMTDTITSLQQELERKSDELRNYAELRDPIREVEKLRAELERLRKEKEQALQRPTFVRVIDIDGKTGKLSFFDPANLDEPTQPILDQKAATALIERHQREAGDRPLYYHFLFPRKETGRPTQAQEVEYKSWFAKVGNSLKDKMP
jgi:hypothetical protein